MNTATAAPTTWHMPGTEGTGNYIVLASSPVGRIGLRVLNGDPKVVKTIRAARVRVEPYNGAESMAAALPRTMRGIRWKQPGDGGEQRFSTVIESTDENGRLLKRVIKIGLTALGEGVEVNPDLPGWMQRLTQSGY